MALIFVVALCGVHELEVQRLLGEFRSLVHALVLPYGGVYEVLSSRLGLRPPGLVFRAKWPPHDCG